MKNTMVTVIDNQTGKPFTGFLVKYTRDEIVIKNVIYNLEDTVKSEVSYMSFDARKVHFKERDRIKRIGHFWYEKKKTKAELKLAILKEKVAYYQGKELGGSPEWVAYERINNVISQLEQR